nr:protein early-responsive to dehydration 7, chloroplastic [Quercus suber]
MTTYKLQNKGCFKVNSDAAVFKASYTAGIGIVVRNWHGAALPALSMLAPLFIPTDLAGNLFPEPTVNHQTSPTAPLKAIEEVLIKIPSTILNLIDKHYSVEVENGDDAENGDLIKEVLIKRMTVRSPTETISSRMTVKSSSRVVRLRQGDDVVAVLVRVADEIQWPLVKDEAIVKLDHSRGVVVLWVDLGLWGPG